MAVSKYLLSFLFIITTLFFSPPQVFAQIIQPFGTGEVETIPGTNEQVATIKGFERVFANITTVVLAFGGVVVFVMFLMAGFKFITSSGDPKAVAGARNTLTYAVYGLLLLALAYLILVFIETFTGAEVTKFRVIPQ